MKETAQERFGPVDVLRFVETDLSSTSPGDVLKRLQGATVGSPASLVLRGDAYIAALKGDPWRPQR